MECKFIIADLEVKSVAMTMTHEELIAIDDALVKARETAQNAEERKILTDLHYDIVHYDYEVLKDGKVMMEVTDD